MFYKIYPLILNEIKVLNKYLNKMLEKGYIQPLIFTVGYPIIFIKKKNSKL